MRRKDVLAIEIYRDFMKLYFAPDKPQWLWIQDYINAELQEIGGYPVVSMIPHITTGQTIEFRLDSGRGPIIGPFVIK